ncbi:MAG: FAD-binding protein [Coriobacteriales bacterium]|jgi:fumarate reductase flavoprotein subunit|nr:FAD-binding protein [Coriobacteriales bacterium]
MENGPFPGFGIAFIDDAIEKGYVYQGETIEELAAAMNVPADTLKATVDRYNELVELGKDLDFGKQPGRLTAIVQPPFYSILRQACLLCALGGLVINDRMEVIDTNRNVIPGLYAAGNNSGNWFGGLEHPMIIPGMSLGRAVVTGYLAGLSATGQEF